MRVALYARVSKAVDQNPENQLIELKRWANAAGHTVEGIYVDEISSRDTRPQKELVLKKLRLGEIDGVAFVALDRWGRNMTELVMELEEFSSSGKSLISLKEGLDLSSAAGRFAANMLAAMANFERDRIRERTIAGLARVKAQGKKLGRPLGWRKDGKHVNGITQNKPSREEVLPFIDSNLSLRELAKKLNTSRYWVKIVLLELKGLGHKIKVIE